MIIIPEIETVLILVPRTASGSFKHALLSRYPRAFMPYRHMEADGVPRGYDRWRRVGVCRHPVDRLWSLYKFLQDGNSPGLTGARTPVLVPSVKRPFNDWVLHNEVAFATGHDFDGVFRPHFHLLHVIPENRKSQFVYLRPDLGTEVFEFGQLWRLASMFGVKLPVVNGTNSEPTPQISRLAADHVRRFCRWELETFGYSINVNTDLQVA